MKILLLLLLISIPNIAFAGLINISLDGTGNYYYGPDDNYTDYTVEDFNLTLTLDTSVTPFLYDSGTDFQLGLYNDAFTSVSLSFLDFEVSGALDDSSFTVLYGDNTLNVIDLASNSNFLEDGTLFIIEMLFLNEHESSESFNEMYNESTIPKSWDRIDVYSIIWGNDQKIIFEGVSFDLDSFHVESVNVPEPNNSAILCIALVLLLIRINRTQH